MRLFCKWLIVCALMLSVGLHWAVLQSAAWAGMILRYSQTESLAVAFQKTFDGGHPCALCKKVSNGLKTEDRKSSAQPSKIKMELDLPKCAKLAFSGLVQQDLDHAEPSPIETSRNASPPLRPPRPVV